MSRRRNPRSTSLVRLTLHWGCTLLYPLLKAFTGVLWECTRLGLRLFAWSVHRYGWLPVLKGVWILPLSLWIVDHTIGLAFQPLPWISVGLLTWGIWNLPRAVHALAERLRHILPFKKSLAPSLDELPLTLSEKSLQTSPWTLENLHAAWQRVATRAGGPGPDGVTVEQFALDLDRNLRRLQEEILEGRYTPQPPRWVEVPKRNGKIRRLAVLCVRDRVVQQVLLSTLTPLWDPRFTDCSYAYRPGRSPLKAVEAVEWALQAGREWILDADIESFFDSVPHRRLFSMLEEWLPDSSIRRLVRACVAATAPESGRGLAQGAPLSPLLANLYLHPFDVAVTQAGDVMIRYADDFVILCATQAQAETSLRRVVRLLQALGLRLNAEKTRVVSIDEGFTFLGYVFTREGKRPTDEAIESLQERLTHAVDGVARHQILMGWHGYFRDVPVEVFQEKTPVGRGSSSNSSSRIPATGSSNATSFLSLYRLRFLGRPDVFARYWCRGGRKGYTPIRRPPEDTELQAHLDGHQVLGTYLLLPDGTTRALVLDVDSPGYDDADRESARSLAHRIVATLKEQEVACLWIDTGGKGFHVWVGFRDPVPARTLRKWGDRLLEPLRPFPEGVIVEIFPKQDRVAPGALGPLVRLPLGRHPETGRWGLLLTDRGTPVPDPEQVLAETSWNIRETLTDFGDSGPVPIPQPPASLEPVVFGCALIQGLVEKAARIRHLRHTERLALLYTLGHCGEAGRVYIHKVIALCDNYDPRITERWIQRLEEGHRPIRCKTLREWLKDHLPGLSCPCLPDVRDPSPVDHLHVEEPSCFQNQSVPEDEWAAVYRTMFEGSEAEEEL